MILKKALWFCIECCSCTDRLFQGCQALTLAEQRVSDASGLAGDRRNRGEPHVSDPSGSPPVAVFDVDAEYWYTLPLLVLYPNPSSSLQ